MIKIKEKKYESKLDLIDTEKGIKIVKDTFEKKLAEALLLQRVSAPRFLRKGDGLQDDLAGTQVPVSFQTKHSDEPIEVVHSLAKWKRKSLARYGFKTGFGLYTDMDAIRKDEDVDDIHSIYVDQWDWEKVIDGEDRSRHFLHNTVKKIYRAMLQTESVLEQEFPELERMLPREIKFIHTQELENKYPELSSKEREAQAAKEYGAYFLIGIGGKLESGEIHDIRAADYDDWSTIQQDGSIGLNGDIIVYDKTRDEALEISSMGIRVNKDALQFQTKEMGLESILNLEFQQDILHERVPLSIGGGIGQSRLCMLLLQKYHIGEVQASDWPDEMRKEYEEKGIYLL